MPRVKEISVNELSRLIREDGNFDLLDIRTPAEIERGVLPDALTLAMHLVPLKLSYFSENSGKVVIYCRTGSRSTKVCQFLQEQGITNVASLRGGIIRWTNAGLPLDPSPKGQVE